VYGILTQIAVLCTRVMVECVHNSHYHFFLFFFEYFRKWSFYHLRLFLYPQNIHHIFTPFFIVIINHKYHKKYKLYFAEYKFVARNYKMIFIACLLWQITRFNIFLTWMFGIYQGFLLLTFNWLNDWNYCSNKYKTHGGGTVASKCKFWFIRMLQTFQG
jgi:hypothetical protein